MTPVDSVKNVVDSGEGLKLLFEYTKFHICGHYII